MKPKKKEIKSYMVNPFDGDPFKILVSLNQNTNQIIVTNKNGEYLDNLCMLNTDTLYNILCSIKREIMTNK